MNKNDKFGDRMKMYEGFETNRLLMPNLPVIARLDGKCFSKFCKGLKKPYDERLTNLMIDVTKELVEETNSCTGYTQSDEISLTWYSDDYKENLYFNGRIFKITSRLSALASVIFNKLLPDFIPEKTQINNLKNLPTFDCRVFNVPNLSEGVNQFLWREKDATKNSISSLAQSIFSHKKLQNKNCNEMQDMLMLEKNINWNDYPIFFKRGTYIQRKLVKSKFSKQELEELPEKHFARQNPHLIVERHIVDKVELPILNSIKNREDVIYFGKNPIV